MSYQLYPSDLTDREWEYIKRLIPAAKSGGRKRQTDMRLTVNAIFYINRTGSQWRYLPREYPPWQTVYGYFRAWRIAGIWEGSVAKNNLAAFHTSDEQAGASTSCLVREFLQQIPRAQLIGIITRIARTMGT